MKSPGRLDTLALHWARTTTRRCFASFRPVDELRRLIQYKWIGRTLAVLCAAACCCSAQPEPVIPVAGQPLAANVTRLGEALHFLGSSLPEDVTKLLTDAARMPDSERLQQVLDEHALFIVELNPESRVKVRRGPAKAVIQQ